MPDSISGLPARRAARLHYLRVAEGQRWGAYLKNLARSRSLPCASDGKQMFHPTTGVILRPIREAAFHRSATRSPNLGPVRLVLHLDPKMVELNSVKAQPSTVN